MREYQIYASRGSQRLHAAVLANNLRDAWAIAKKQMGGYVRFEQAYVPEYGKSFYTIK